MCLTLANATAIIDHHPSQRSGGRGFTRTWHHAAQLSPGDLGTATARRPKRESDQTCSRQRCWPSCFPC